jgi:hypothetical protein
MNSNQLTNAIIATYTARIDELPKWKKRHFLYRAVKATGRQNIQDLLIKKTKASTLESGRQVVKQYHTDYQQFLIKQHRRLGAYKTRKINDQQKKVQWESLPDVYAFHNYLWSLYYLSLFNSQPQEIAVKKIAYIFQQLFSHPQFIKYAVVCASNLVYLSRSFALFDAEAEFINQFQQIFTPKDIASDDIVFTNYIYGLTHIVIGESFFYQQPVDKAKLKWVEQALTQHAPEIFSRLTLDVNTETALCLKMLGVPQSDYLKLVEQRLIENFNTVEGYITRESHNSFSYAEHTNAIALLLFRADYWNR